MRKLQKCNQEQRKTLNSLAYVYLFDPDTVQVNCISTEKSAQWQQHTRGDIILTKFMEYLFLGSWITTG